MIFLSPFFSLLEDKVIFFLGDCFWAGAPDTVPDGLSGAAAASTGLLEED